MTRAVADPFFGILAKYGYSRELHRNQPCLSLLIGLFPDRLWRRCFVRSAAVSTRWARMLQATCHRANRPGVVGSSAHWSDRGSGPEPAAGRENRVKVLGGGPHLHKPLSTSGAGGTGSLVIMDIQAFHS